MDSFKVTAPSRVDLAGGTLDIWPLYCFTGGAKTINLAIDLCAWATVDVVPDSQFQIRLHYGSEEPVAISGPMAADAIQRLSPPLRFPAHVISSYLANKAELPEVRIRLTLGSDVPPQSGLGGSSTLCVAIGRALARVFGDYIIQGWQWRMMEWARDTEAGYLTMLTGTQDYLAALFGGANCFVSDRGNMDRVPYSDAVFQGLADRLLVLYSGETHQSGISNWELVKGAVERDKEIQRGMEAARQIAEDLDGELSAGQLSWKHIGNLLTQEWEIRKHLFKVHTKRLDEMVQFLQKQDVLGARVCGAAAGGSLMALVDPDRRATVAKECETHGIQVLKTQATKQGAFAS